VFFDANVAFQYLERLWPLNVSRRFPGAERNAECAEVRRTARLLGTGVDVRARIDDKLDKSRRSYRQLELPIQESARNSTGPERDILLRAWWHLFLDDNVAYLEPSTSLEHPRHFAHGGVLVGHQVQHAIRDHHIRPRVADRQCFTESLTKLSVRDVRGGACASLREHLRCHVDANNVPGRSDHSRRNQAVDTPTAADVYDALAGVQNAHAERIAGSGERRDGGLWNVAKPLCWVPEKLGQRAADKKVKAVLRQVGDERVFVLDCLRNSSRSNHGG
jgi:hypothetical protein